MASAGGGSPESHKAYRPETRLSELNAERPLPPAELRLGETRWASGDCDGDAASLRAAPLTPWDGGVTLERCVSCMSKLGALSRSSTAVLTPGAKHFSPAWTMEALSEAAAADAAPDGTLGCHEVESPDGRTPARPPRPMCLEPTPGGKLPMPLPTPSCICNSFSEGPTRAGVGPYENYDVPRIPCTEVSYQLTV